MWDPLGAELSSHEEGPTKAVKLFNSEGQDSCESNHNKQHLNFTFFSLYLQTELFFGSIWRPVCDVKKLFFCII